MRTLIFHESIADEIIDAMRVDGAPGDLVPCSTDVEFEAEIEACDVLMAAHCHMAPVMRSTRLRWVQSLASGIESWLLPPGPPQCPITRMTGVYEVYMAEYVMAHLLYRSQELEALRDSQEKKRWIEALGLQAISLRGKTMGIAGLGHVGSEVARLASAFGLNIMGCTRTRTIGDHEANGLQIFSLDEKRQFLTGLDFLVLAMPLTPQTTHFVDEEALEALPSRAVIVNISRGGLVDENALTAAVVGGRLAGAVLDTFEKSHSRRIARCGVFPT